MSPDDIERVALALATHAADVALRHNLAEIDQLDKIDQWKAHYGPVNVTEHDRALARVAIEAMARSVWVYHGGHGDEIKVFATADAARAWFEKNDPEGVAFEHEVIDSTNC